MLTFQRDLAKMGRRLKITIIGPGALGRVLAIALHRAGYTVDEVVSSGRSASKVAARDIARRIGARAVAFSEAEISSDLVWITVPDRRIEEVAEKLSRRRVPIKYAVHSSGAQASSELRVLTSLGQGTLVASAHPMMSFVAASKATLSGVPFALEGDSGLLQILRKTIADLGGRSFLIPTQAKAQYHALGALVSPMLIALFSMAEGVGGKMGLRGKEYKALIEPIVQQTVQNYFQTSAAEAFSGPIRRGDTEIIKKHLKTVAHSRPLKAAYAALARHAIEALPARNKKALRKLLAD